MSEDRVIPVEQTTDMPTLKIKSEGSEISNEFHVVSVTVEKEVNRIPKAQIILLDGDTAKEDFEISNQDHFIPGKKIEIHAGYHSDESLIFKGIVINHRIKARKGKASYLYIDCRDESVKMTVGRKNKYYYDSTDSDIFSEILGKYSLDTDIEPTEASHKEMVQYYSTDWDFIVSRAEMNGMLVTANDGKFSVKKPDTSSDPVLSLVYGSSMLDFEAEMESRDQYSTVKSNSWDYSSQEVIEEEGTDPGVTESGNISSDDLADVMNLEELSQRHGGKVSDMELKAWASSRILKSKLAKIRGRVKSQGYGDINPGDMLELNGVGDRFNGKNFVSAVRHQINLKNWETDIQFGLSPEWFSKSQKDIIDTPAAGLLPAVQGLQIGIVTQLEDDPDGEDRVLVKMPMISSDEDGVWARVATLDAGDSRGSFFRPEIGDEVLLGYLNEDPRFPVILGMMNSSAKPAPITAKDSNPEKGFITRSEMKLLFDDEKKVITVETPGGNKIVLSDDEGAVNLEDQNGNKITMDSDGITMESAKDVAIKASGDVKIEGINSEIKANSQFKAEGAAGAEVSSSAVMTIKGSLVQIN